MLLAELTDRLHLAAPYHKCPHEIARDEKSGRGLSPSLRRPVSVKRFSLFFSFSFLLYFFFFQIAPIRPSRLAASVATLPSALFVERSSLGASRVYSIQ